MLTRRFVLQGFESTAWLWFLIAALIAVTCIIALFAYERRLISRRLGLTLLGLRLAAVAAVFTALLEPVLTWTINRERTGRVLVSVDVSDSMGTADRHADSAEKLQWLRALGMLGNATTDERLDRWVETFQNGREPDWVDPGEATTPQERAELAESRRQQLHELFDTISQMPRRELARRLLSSGTDSIQSRLARLAILEMQAFAGTSTTAADPQILERIVSEPESELRPESTDLVQGMTSVATDSGETPLAGIVLLTDGRDNTSVDPSRLSAKVGSIAVPVYPVLIGSQQRPRDLGLAAIDYPEVVYQNDSALLRAAIGTGGFEGNEITVLLEEEESSEPPQSQVVRVENAVTDVQFDLDASELGRKRYVVRIEGHPDETRSDNNQRRFSINVVDDQSNVLLLDGAAGWEFRFLDNALTRDEHVSVSKVVYQQPFMGVLPGPFFPRSLDLPPPGEDLRQTPFAEFDLVIIGDVAPSQLSSGFWEWLDRFVRDEGGTVVLTAGRNHFPLAHQSPILTELLPVSELRQVLVGGASEVGPPQHRGIDLWLTPDGERQEMMQLDAELVQNRRIWDALPGQTYVIRGVARPAATVLASLPDTQQERRLEHERQNAIIVHHHVGSGQVLWIGCDGTWRWRHRVGDKYHHRFWGQIVRWAADFKAAIGNEHVKFGLESTEVEVGEDALIRARWNERFLSQFPDLKATAEVRPLHADPGAPPVLTVPLLPTESRPLIHDGKASGLTPGDYTVVLKVEGADLGNDVIQTDLTVSERMTSELGDLSANRLLLEQIADATGGRVFLPHEAHQIPDLFHDVTQRSSAQRDLSLWDHWLTLALLFGLLTTEWVLRKLNGLP